MIICSFFLFIVLFYSFSLFFVPFFSDFLINFEDHACKDNSHCDPLDYCQGVIKEEDAANNCDDFPCG